MMQRVVKVEAKAGLRLATMVRDLDICYSKCHRPYYATSAKIQTQEFNKKKFKFEKFRAKELKPSKDKTAVPLCF